MIGQCLRCLGTTEIIPDLQVCKEPLVEKTKTVQKQYQKVHGQRRSQKTGSKGENKVALEAERELVCVVLVKMEINIRNKSFRLKRSVSEI